MLILTFRLNARYSFHFLLRYAAGLVLSSFLLSYFAVHLVNPLNECANVKVCYISFSCKKVLQGTSIVVIQERFVLDGSKTFIGRYIEKNISGTAANLIIPLRVGAKILFSISWELQTNNKICSAE